MGMWLMGIIGSLGCRGLRTLVWGTSRGLWGVEMWGLGVGAQAVAQESPCPRVPQRLLPRVLRAQVPCHAGQEPRHLPRREGTDRQGDPPRGPGLAPGPVTVPAVPAGAAGSVGGPSLQCHGQAGAGGESGDSGGVWLVPPHPTAHPTPLQGLSREAAKRLRFIPGLVYVEGEGAPLLLLHVQLPIPCSMCSCRFPAHSLSCCPFPASLPIPALLPIPCPS